jgi:hypothetical protein
MQVLVTPAAASAQADAMRSIEDGKIAGSAPIPSVKPARKKVHCDRVTAR